MKTTKLITHCFISLLFFNAGCRPALKNCFSYSLESYSLEKTKKLLTTSHLMSYGNYLIEFKMVTNYNTTLTGETGIPIRTISFDTVGVYLLANSNGNKLYYEFDTFSLSNRIVKWGDVSEKEFGRHYINNTQYASQDSFILQKPVKRKVGDSECYFSGVKSKFNNNDSINFELLLIKDKSFNSFYKFNGFNFTDNQYCITGISFFDRNKNEGFVEEIGKLRFLKPNERAICEAMVQKSLSAKK